MNVLLSERKSKCFSVHGSDIIREWPVKKTGRVPENGWKQEKREENRSERVNGNSNFPNLACNLFRFDSPIPGIISHLTAELNCPIYI